MGKMDFTQGSRGLWHRLTSIFRETENGYSELNQFKKQGSPRRAPEKMGGGIIYGIWNLALL